MNSHQRSSIGVVILFPEFSTEMDESNKHLLTSFISQLRGKTNKIDVRGHASRRPHPPTSPYKDAWQLSYARSLAVMKFLTEAGIDPKRFRLSQAAGYEPLSRQTQGPQLENNARVEIFLLNEYADDLAPDSESKAKKLPKKTNSQEREKPQSLEESGTKTE